MSLFNDIVSSLLHWYTERSARGRSFEELSRMLEESGRKIDARLDGAKDTPINRRQARHVIGIERWGQQRLRVALGEPLVLDEYDGYRPPADSEIAVLRGMFQETRRETIELVKEFEQAGLSPEQTVRHNDLGELSLRGWLKYLIDHATRETLMVR